MVDPSASQVSLPLAERRIADPARAYAAHRRLLKLVATEVVVIALLGLCLILAVPLTRPQLVYQGFDPDSPDRAFVAMEGLPFPILTQESVLSWATTTVTEVMTYNFANYDQRISEAKNRFTDIGWIGFVKALVESESIEKFKFNQLVLTTAPRDTAVLISEGDVDGRYQWVVQVPVIQTYVTNNNRSERKKSLIELTIVRRSTLESPWGIGIDIWKEM